MDTIEVMGIFLVSFMFMYLVEITVKFIFNARAEVLLGMLFILVLINNYNNG